MENEKYVKLGNNGNLKSHNNKELVDDFLIPASPSVAFEELILSLLQVYNIG